MHRADQIHFSRSSQVRCCEARTRGAEDEHVLALLQTALVEQRLGRGLLNVSKEAYLKVWVRYSNLYEY